MKHMKKKPNSQDECGVGERGGIIVCGLLPPSADSFHRPRTPSTARGLLPPPAGGPPPSKREVLGFRRSKPAALPSIGYRGFAVAPITLRAPSRSHLYNPGCRVATLLVLMGVMGFLGDLRGRNSKSPPNPLGLAERVLRPQAVEGVGGGSSPSPSLLCRTSFYFSTHVRHTRHKKHMKHTRNRS